MFDLQGIGVLDAEAALATVEQAQRDRRHAEVVEALGMLRLLRVYRHEVAADKVCLAGDGTPAVDEFCCLELAAALRRSVASVTCQLIDLLNLEVRHPRLWEVAIGGGVPLWLARQVAQVAAELSLPRALWLDQALTPFVTRLGPGRILRFAEALVTQADPAQADRRRARTGRRVEVGGTRDGVRDVWGTIDAADGVFLQAALTQLADILRAEGSTETPDERRATALGILATPARALAMIQHALQPALIDATDDADAAGLPAALNDAGSGLPAALNDAGSGLPAALDDAEAEATHLSSARSPGAGTPAAERDGDLGPDTEQAAAGTPAARADGFDGPAADAVPGLRSPGRCAGHVCGTITVPPDRLRPPATLVLHLSEETLLTGRGIGRCEQLGPVTLDHLRHLLSRTEVVVRPVFDPDGIVGVDAYEIPERIRRAVLLRHPWEVFPYSARPSPRLDLDHTRPYRWDGTPAQTDPDNLGPLSRKVHRAKTRAGWRLRQPHPGLFTWRSPLGRDYRITPDGLTHSDPDHHPPSDPDPRKRRGRTTQPQPTGITPGRKRHRRNRATRCRQHRRRGGTAAGTGLSTFRCNSVVVWVSGGRHAVGRRR